MHELFASWGRCHMCLMPNCRVLDAWIGILCASTGGVRVVRSQACSLSSCCYFFRFPSYLLPPSSQPCLLPCTFPHLTLGPSVSPFLSFCHVSPAACRRTQHPRPVLTLVQRSLADSHYFSFDSTSLHARPAPFSRSFQLTLESNMREVISVRPLHLGLVSPFLMSFSP